MESALLKEDTGKLVFTLMETVRDALLFIKRASGKAWFCSDPLS